MAARILIADDHDHLRAALSELLQKTGDNWSVCAVADGKAAIEKAGEVKPDVVVLDLLMPRRNGMSAGREIRAILPGVPVILFTSVTSASLDADARRAGFYSVVHKANASDLITVIRKALAKRGLRSASAS